MGLREQRKKKEEEVFLADFLVWLPVFSFWVEAAAGSKGTRQFKLAPPEPTDRDSCK
jgi:hypothetical protein